MNRVVVTGIGVVSSLGNTLPELVRHLQDSQHGFSPFPARDGVVCPPKLYGASKGFQTNDCDPESWTYPAKYSIPRAAIKGMAPHVLYSYCSTIDALADAGLDAAAVSDPMTGLYSASAGSSVILHHQLQMMNVQGVKRCSPFGVVAATTGTINFNLSAHFKIMGATCGMASACASSAHALGFAYDAIATGRQERMLVIGAEDGNRESILPFAAMRALSTSADPRRHHAPLIKIVQVLWAPEARRRSSWSRKHWRARAGQTFTQSSLDGAKRVMDTVPPCLILKVVGLSAPCARRSKRQMWHPIAWIMSMHMPPRPRWVTGQRCKRSNLSFCRHRAVYPISVARKRSLDMLYRWQVPGGRDQLSCD